MTKILKTATGEPILPAPWTADQLEMARGSRRARLQHAASTLPGLLGSVATCAVMGMSVIAGNWLPWADTGANMATALLAGIAILGVIWAANSDVDHHAMSESLCDQMGRLLDRLPDGEKFRQAVVAQGRFFTVEEFKVVEKTSAAHAEWYERAIREKQRLASCQRLYGVAADGSLDEENR